MLKRRSARLAAKQTDGTPNKTADSTPIKWGELTQYFFVFLIHLFSQNDEKEGKNDSLVTETQELIQKIANSASIKYNILS